MSEEPATTYLRLEDLLAAHRAIHAGAEPQVRDAGLLASALARPQATVGGADAYPDLATKAAALMQSLARNHALIDGNKRLAWVATALFLGLNDVTITPPSTDALVDLMLAVATGALEDIDQIAALLTDWTRSA